MPGENTKALPVKMRKEGMNEWVLQFRSYHDEIETRNQEENPSLHE